MKLGPLQTGAAILAVLAATQAVRADDRIVEVGRLRLAVSDRGVLRQFTLGGREVLLSLFLAANSGGREIQHKGRLWQGPQDAGKPGVTIRVDPKLRGVVITREGRLGHAGGKPVLAYTQRVVLSEGGRIECAYDVEHLETLTWRPHAIVGVTQIPLGFTGGKPLFMDDGPPRTPPEVWSKAAQVVGSFRRLRVAGITAQVGVNQTGTVTDERAWGRWQKLFVAIGPGAAGGAARRVPKGTKRRIRFTIQLPRATP